MQSRFQILARRSQVLEQFHFAVEVDEERFVLVLAQDVLEEFVAGVALLIEDAHWLPLVSRSRPSVRGRSLC